MRVRFFLSFLFFFLFFFKFGEMGLVNKSKKLTKQQIGFFSLHIFTFLSS